MKKKLEKLKDKLSTIVPIVANFDNVIYVKWFGHEYWIKK